MKWNANLTLNEWKIKAIDDIVKNFVSVKIFPNLALSDYMTVFYQYIDSSEHKDFSEFQCKWRCQAFLKIMDYRIMKSDVLSKICLNIFMFNDYSKMRINN